MFSCSGRAFFIGTEDNLQNNIIIPVKRRISYPQFKQSDLLHDLGLLLLKKEIPFSSNIRPACINLQGDIKDSATAADWDHHQMNVPIIDQRECNNHYRVRDILDSEQVCAQLKKNCEFKTGSLLHMKHPHVENMYSIVGVFTIRKDCLNGHSVVVYTRVSQFASWIESTAFN